MKCFSKRKISSFCEKNLRCFFSGEQSIWQKKHAVLPFKVFKKGPGDVRLGLEMHGVRRRYCQSGRVAARVLPLLPSFVVLSSLPLCAGSSSNQAIERNGGEGEKWGPPGGGDGNDCDSNKQSNKKPACVLGKKRGAPGRPEGADINQTGVICVTRKLCAN